MIPSPTPYEDVNTLVGTLLAKAQAILHDNLIGFYLYGSLSLGDFDPESSDVDFLIVTATNVSAGEFDALRTMHADLAASGLRFADHLEGSYIPRDALRRYDPNNVTHPTIGIDWPFMMGQHGENWILERHIIREHGVVVWGPLPKTLIDPVPMSDLKSAVCGQILGFWRSQLDTPEWFRSRDYQAFVALTMCRALYTLHEGDVVSKPAAAAWALAALDPRWRSVIERAVIWRHDHAPDDLTDTLSFMRYAIDKTIEMCS